jgi:hypothetical protein
MLFFHAKQMEVAPFAFAAPSGRATKRAAYQQRMLKARYNAAALVFSAAKISDASIVCLRPGMMYNKHRLIFIKIAGGSAIRLVVWRRWYLL